MAERPGVLRINDRVVFSGTEHTVVALSGNTVRLLSAAGETTVVALPYLLSAEDFRTGQRVRISPQSLLEALPEHVAETAQFWERHLVEMETGLPPNAPEGTTPKPEYDPLACSMTERERAKAAELSAAGINASIRTVQRMRNRYREQGLWGLVDTRYARRAKPTGNVDPRVVAAAVAVIEKRWSMGRAWCPCPRRRPVIACWRHCRPGGTHSGRQ
ncbi:hypothetical protein [Nonomuraea sp. 10N515B]|uniref:hypothetical protein n=1 Tax=Nonomuraea sp. 10N515B TaxID=3457422 RepID=UPI003FCCA965